MQRLTGVYNILTTPFLPAGDLDGDSLRRLTEGVVAAGGDGITVVGVAGEAQKLSGAERDHVVSSRAGGRRRPPTGFCGRLARGYRHDHRGVARSGARRRGRRYDRAAGVPATWPGPDRAPDANR